MRIYLAGKITKNGWRNDIFGDGGIHENRPDFIAGDINMNELSQWPISKNKIFGKHDYTGPYFIADDHGCAHGDHSHGVGIDHEWNPDLGDSVPSRQQVNKLALRAIDLSDLVFVWIEANDCYGTIAEIGYAAGKGKAIHIAGKYLPDLWFVYNMATYKCDFESKDPKTALQSFLNSDRKEVKK